MKAKEKIELKYFKGYPQHELNYINLPIKGIVELMEDYAKEYHLLKMKEYHEQFKAQEDESRNDRR